MGSPNPDSETKQEFDDSGYVQEDKESTKPSSDEYRGVTVLLDLSDDVLLYILQYCSPMDLKALGFTCNRLAALILDRTLWQRVDARDRPCGPRRVRWFMAHAIGYNTTAILFSGYARDTKGNTGQTKKIDKIDFGASGDGPSTSKASTSQASTSQASTSQASTSQASSSLAAETEALAQSIMSQLKKTANKNSANQDSGEASGSQDVTTNKASGSKASTSQKGSKAKQASKEEEPKASSSKESNAQPSTSKASANQAPAERPAPRPNRGANGVVPPPRRPSNPEEERVLPPRLYRLTSQSMPRYGNQIPYWPESLLRSDHPTSPSPKLSGNGPQVTMTSRALEHLSALCPKLEELALEYCIIDCATVNLSMFPNYLKRLSFCGSKCYNMEKSFLFKIQDYLPELEVLNLSYCEWVEPACMLPLSKLQNLHTLFMRECPKLSEFVAYASLATRYGFKALKVLDLRGSPVGDSEVSALGWLPRLEQLLLARAEPRAPRAAPAYVAELEPWEEDEPEFFRNKKQNHAWLYDEPYTKPNTVQNETPRPIEECLMLERMIAEPVAPDEYSSVYQRFFPGPCPPNSGPAGPGGGQLATPDEYRDAYSSFLNRNLRHEAPSAFIISNNRTYSIVHNEDENGNDPNSQALRFVQCRPDMLDDDEMPGPSSDDPEEPSPGPSNDNEKPGPSRVCDENGNDDGPTPAKKMKKDGPCPGPSKLPSEKNRKSSTKKRNDDKKDDESDSDDDSPKKKKHCQRALKTAPSTSKSKKNKRKEENEPSSSTCQNSEATSNEAKTQRYVRFRQNQPPVVVDEVSNNNNDNSNNNNDEQNNEEQNNNADDDTNDNREPKHRILFVNVGRRRHAMYQLSMPVCTVAEPVDLRTNNVAPNSRNVSSLIYASPVSSRLDHGALVTDTAIRRFGRADGENISYVHIGPNGPIPAPYDDPNARPNRSNLRVLSATGFRNITNTSLVHLATAAPHLRFIDFTGTSVTRDGVENFRSLRPDCTVRYSNYEKKDKPT